MGWTKVIPQEPKYGVDGNLKEKIKLFEIKKIYITDMKCKYILNMHY